MAIMRIQMHTQSLEVILSLWIVCVWAGAAAGSQLTAANGGETGVL